MAELFKLKVKTAKLIKRLDKIARQKLMAMVAGMSTGVRLFKSHIVQTQMSGRKAPGFGLRRRTGKAAQSWVLTDVRSAAGYFASRLGWRAFYLATHQTGKRIRATRGRWLTFKWGPGKKDWAKVKEVNIRKRLRVFESWRIRGPEFTINAMRERLARVRT